MLIYYNYAHTGPDKKTLKKTRILRLTIHQLKNVVNHKNYLHNLLAQFPQKFESMSHSFLHLSHQMICGAPQFMQNLFVPYLKLHFLHLLFCCLYCRYEDNNLFFCSAIFSFTLDDTKPNTANFSVFIVSTIIKSCLCNKICANF